jgi:hypothetical protein
MLTAAGGGLPSPPVAASWQAGISRAVGSLAHLTQLKHLQLRFICGERGVCDAQLMACLCFAGRALAARWPQCLLLAADMYALLVAFSMC